MHAANASAVGGSVSRGRPSNPSAVTLARGWFGGPLLRAAAVAVIAGAGGLLGVLLVWLVEGPAAAAATGAAAVSAAMSLAGAAIIAPRRTSIARLSAATYTQLTTGTTINASLAAETHAVLSGLARKHRDMLQALSAATHAVSSDNAAITASEHSKLLRFTTSCINDLHISAQSCQLHAMIASISIISSRRSMMARTMKNYSSDTK